MKEIMSLDQTNHQIHLKNTVIVVSFHALAIVALFYFSWQNLIVLLILNWMVASLGIGIGFHRLLTHRGFKTPKWLEYGLTVLGSLAIQDGAIKWVATHRIHHAHTETEQDPHSPRERGGFWAHAGWILRGDAQEHDAATIARYVPDLLKDSFHVRLARYYAVPSIILALLLLAIGGWTMVLWGIFLRTVVGWHETWLVNSATHMWGTRRFETKDDSTNNPIVGILAFGEGWHNNHHAHPTSARHGLKWYELDMNWLTIKLFEKIGLAKQVKVYKS
jgi:stearoyl-CoA desaturase (delta-9 desaturase)